VFEFNPMLVTEDDDDNDGEVFVHARSQVNGGVACYCGGVAS